MTRKAPSEGQKVTLGQNAPIKSEAAGPVSSESLAAESYREGGEFAKNVDAQPENISATSHLELTSEMTSTREQQSVSKSNAGTAPTYVNSQRMKDPNGPHGKNIQEGFDDSGLKDGTKVAMDAKLGSKDDPSRAAMLQSQDVKGRAAGPKQDSLEKENKYDTLSSEASS